jgi:hypothetical protein
LHELRNGFDSSLEVEQMTIDNLIVLEYWLIWQQG